MGMPEYVREAEVPFYDPRDPAIAEDPFPAFSRLRQHDPVHWSPSVRGWVLTRFDDVRNSMLLSADRITPYVSRQSEGERERSAGLEAIALWPSMTDPPLHTRLRTLMNQAINARTIAASEPAVREIVERLVDHAVEQGDVDVVADFADKVPISVIAWMLGLPESDIEPLRKLADDVALFVGAAKGLADRHQRGARAVSEMTAYYREATRQRRASPKDDAISRLVFAEIDGERLAEDELVAICVMLQIAGHVTTAHLLGNGLVALLRNPDQLALLRRDRSLTRGAVEEMFRYDGPIQAMVRVAPDDIEFHGTTIRKGDRIFPMLNAANRDPERFDDPDTFNVARPDARQHMVFGYGHHTCLGMPLARLEIPIAFDRLLDRCSQIELSGPVTWIDSVAFRGPQTLPVTFRPN